jgi:uncharacterized membrane protein
LGKADEGRGENIIYMLERLAIYDSEIAQLMEQVGSGMPVEDAACGFARNYETRWRSWIPQNINWCEVDEMTDKETGECVTCKEGYVPTSDVSACIPCSAGYYCRKGSKPLLCDPGFYCPEASVSQLPCKEGTANSLAGSNSDSACLKCGPGTFMDKEGRSVCKNCAPGTFQDILGQPSCKQCAIGFYQTDEAKPACEACPATFTTKYPATTTPLDCTCVLMYFWNQADDVCEPCQNGGECPGGFEPPTVWEDSYGVYVGSPSPQHVKDKKAGKYIPVKEAFSKLKIYSCRSGQCLTEPETCPEKRTGIACAICEAGYYASDCRLCGSGDGTFVILVLIIVLAPFGMWSGAVLSSRPYAAKSTAAFAMASTFGIMALFMQMLGMMTGFNVSWPFKFDVLFGIANIFLLDLESLGIGCIVGNDFVPQYYVSLLLPVFIMVIMVIVVPVSSVTPAVSGRGTKVSVDAGLNFLGMVYSALYISLVKIVTSYFECVPNHDAADTLMKYKQVECYSSEHNVGIPMMALGMIFYVVGFFCLCLYLNVIAPTKFKDARFRNQCKFLVNRWRVDVWYWGTVYMVRNLCLALVAVVSSTAIDQFIIMGVVMVAFLTLSSAYMPWKDERLAQFDNAVSLVIAFAICCGIGFMHLLTVKEFYSRDTSERAREVREDSDARLAIFSALLLSALGLAAFLFFVLLVYCVWWGKHTDRLAKEEGEMQKMLMERWTVTLKHDDFLAQFNRYIETGTEHDIRSLVELLDNMQRRLGGVDGLGAISPQLRATISKSGGKQRLRMSGGLAALTTAVSDDSNGHMDV